MTTRAELERLIAGRAEDRCEYRRMHQGLQGARFHLEHVITSSRGGNTNQDNPAWACPGCNLRKSDRVEAMDPATGESVPLFSPRACRWSEHFYWDDYQVSGLTGVGRATNCCL